VFVDLIESLRCPREHADSPLVVTASRTDARHVMEGMLGCPVCHAEFPIREGEALFATDADATAAAPSAETAMRLAAFLDMTDPRGFVILCGSWGAHAEEVRAISSTSLLLVNPPKGVDVSGTGIVRVRGRLPVASSSARAAALAEGSDVALVTSAIAAVRPNGRLVGPVTMPLPEGVRELTRDAQMWIAEKETLHGIAGRISRTR
jgi:uncharacterized protein YbaR (Trm112 family)